MSNEKTPAPTTAPAPTPAVTTIKKRRWYHGLLDSIGEAIGEAVCAR